jgi:hypothetical protein
VAQRRIVQRVSVEEQQRALRTKIANIKYHSNIIVAAGAARLEFFNSKTIAIYRPENVSEKPESLYRLTSAPRCLEKSNSDQPI